MQVPYSIITDPQVTIILAVLFARFKEATYSFPFIGIAFNLAGTFLHELAHYLMAIVLNAKPSSFSLLPKRTINGWILGHVEVQNPTWYNLLPIGFAPLSLFVGAFYANAWYSSIPEHTIWSDLLYLLALVILIENAIPSWQDVKIAVGNLLGVIAYSMLLSYVILKTFNG